MLDLILAPLAYPFMVRGLLAAVLVGVVCAVVGTYVVLRGMAFFGDALAHTVLPGVAVGYLAIVQGGAEEGAHLCQHGAIDAIHVTGAERTYDAIVFGTGAEGARRKAAREPQTSKTVTGELGSVSPVIIVPGPWSEADLRYQGLNIVSMLVNNAGFNCNAGRVIVQHASWPLREALLDATRRWFERSPTRRAYYPGAHERHARFLEQHPDAERIGEADAERLPWTLIPHLDPNAPNEICFEEEAFCGLIAETALDAPSPAAFLERAVQFCNERLRGTLNVTVIVHPATMRDHTLRPLVDRMIAELRYGTVCINHWASLGYALCSTPWGAFPGHEPHDIQSGVGFVHNAFMVTGVQKTIVRTLFRAFPKPPWFVDHKSAHKLGRVLTEFEARPSWLRLPLVSWHALRA
ncbi:MAG: aldehyde dehydrogenase family protein [Acidobacteria bacterium]|nr:aldehyde dehydrogenase family protein [Acidobacteriota bacterium]